VDGGISGSAVSPGDAGTLELLADRAPMNAQLGTDLAQGPTLGVQVSRTLNVHGATVTSLRGIGFPEPGCSAGACPEGPVDPGASVWQRLARRPSSSQAVNRS
jgi:hypothetical protein